MKLKAKLVNAKKGGELPWKLNECKRVDLLPKHPITKLEPLARARYLYRNSKDPEGAPYFGAALYLEEGSSDFSGGGGRPSKSVLTPYEGAWKRTSEGGGTGSSSSSTVGALVGGPWRSPLEPRDGIQSRNFQTYFLCVFFCLILFLNFYIPRVFTGIFFNFFFAPLAIFY